MVSSVMTTAILVWDGMPVGEKVWFCTFSTGVSMLNLILLGLEVGFTGFYVEPADRGVWIGIDLIISIIFNVETFIRFKGYGPWWWFFGAAYPEYEPAQGVFNVVDAMLAVSRSLFFLNFLGMSQTGKLLSTLRVVMHIGNLARVRQTTAGYRELWAFILAMLSILTYLAWISIMMLGMLFWFGVVMTILVDSENNIYDYSSSPFSPWQQDQYWGSVPQSMLTMFQVLTLDHWYSRIARPLIVQHPSFSIVFILFLLVGNIGLLNLITSFIVEATLVSSADAEERRGKERQYLDKLVMASFRAYVEQADDDNSGEIDNKELDFLTKTYIVKDRLRLLGIAPSDLELLFTLLDESDNGKIPINKFFRGVLRLRGDAMASDLYKLHTDVSRSITRATSLVKGLDSTNEILVHLIDSMTGMDVGIVKGDDDIFDEVLHWKRKHIEEEAAHKDAKEREHQMMVRFGIDEGETEDMLAIGDKPHKHHHGHSSKKLMHASLRDGVTHVPDHPSEKGGQSPGMISRNTSRKGIAKGRQNTQKTLGKSATAYSIVTKGSVGTAETGKYITHGLAVRTKTGLGVFKTQA